VNGVTVVVGGKKLIGVENKEVAMPDIKAMVQIIIINK